MSHNPKPGAPPLALARDPQAVIASVKQLIANGKSRTALERAKDFHKSQHTSGSEELLMDAYAARVQSLLDLNLSLEAKSLIDIVRERFPAHQQRFASLRASASAHGGELTELLAPLQDPQLSPERRAEIDRIVQTQLTDLSALAACPTLPPENSLRQAARAIDIAFNLVTSGPVTDEQIALPEVSHRSPLAPWKVLIRAIACFHRGESQQCQEQLAAIKPDSVPARLIPALKAMLGLPAPGTLGGAATALAAAAVVSYSGLRRALAEVDRGFAEGLHPGTLYKAARTAAEECRRSAPDLLVRLKQLVFIRGGLAGLEDGRLATALGGAPHLDAEFLRMFARVLEQASDPNDLAQACEVWESFREHAVGERWFPAEGVETAAIYLRMAGIVGKLPPPMLRQIQKPGRSARTSLALTGERDRYFVFPEKLYARACALDPHSQSFSPWITWAARQSAQAAEAVAGQWHQALPGSLEPILHLLEATAKRNAFPTALAYLEKAERIDAVHPVVRTARLQLLTASALRHVEQKKPHLATQKLALLAQLPQIRQGDRPALLPALRHLIALKSDDAPAAADALGEVEALLGGTMPGGLLVSGLASITRQLESAGMPLLRDLTAEQRLAIPEGLAKAAALARDLDLTKFKFPVIYLGEAASKFEKVRHTLSLSQVLSLAELGLATGHPQLTWSASGTGLERGGPLEAQFMLLRAKAIPRMHAPRLRILASAAAALGRLHGQPDVVEDALKLVRTPFDDDAVALTTEQAREIVRRELASPAFPALYRQGPDYSDLLPEEVCQCPDCRRARGEPSNTLDYDLDGTFDDKDGDEFDDWDDGRAFEDTKIGKVLGRNAGSNMPPELAAAFAEFVKEAGGSGPSLDEAIAQILQGARGQRNRSKKKR